MDTHTEALLGRFEREYLELHSISADRRVKQLKLLRRLTDTLGHPLHQLTAAELTTFIGAEVGRGLHPNTAMKHLTMVRSFVNWAGESRVMAPDLIVELKLISKPRGTRPSRPRPYSAAEVQEFYRLLAEKYPALPLYGRGSKAMHRFMHGKVPRMRRHLWRHARRLQFEAQVALALEMGLRSIEIGRLTIPALHYDNDQLVVLTAKQGPHSKVHRDIPYTAHAREVITEWLDFRLTISPGHTYPWLQLDYTGSLDAQLAPQNYHARRKSLYEAFGGQWEWHRFRHTAATFWLRAGVPLEKLRVYMGHASIEQTLAYAQIVASDINRDFGRSEATFAKLLGLAA